MSGSPPHSQRSMFLSLAVRIYSSPLFTKSDVHSVSLALRIPLYLSAHLLSLGESVALGGRASFFWKPAIGHDMMGQGTNQ